MLLGTAINRYLRSGCRGGSRVRTRWERATEMVLAEPVEGIEDSRGQDSHPEGLQFDPFVKAIFDLVPESIVLVDPQGTILALNKAAAEMLGRPVEQLIGIRPVEIIRDGIRSAAYIRAGLAMIKRACQTGLAQQSKIRYAGRYLQTAYYPIRSDDGQVRQVLVFGRQLGRQLGDRSGPGPVLTPVETRVLRLILKGRSNKQIAHQMHRSRRTIEVHRANVMLKFKVHNLAQLIKKSAELGLWP